MVQCALFPCKNVIRTESCTFFPKIKIHFFHFDFNYFFEGINEKKVVLEIAKKWTAAINWLFYSGIKSD